MKGDGSMNTNNPQFSFVFVVLLFFLSVVLQPEVCRCVVCPCLCSCSDLAVLGQDGFYFAHLH